MVRPINRLSALAVKTLSAPGRYADGGRLYLSINDKGGKRWVFLYVLAGRQREMGLGGVNDVSLAQARKLAQAAREQLAEGTDPLEARAAKKAVPTFGDVADEVFKTVQAASRNDKHIYQWQKSLEVEAKALRSLKVDAIGTEEVLRVLRPMWETVPETASRLRGRIERVLDAAAAKGHRPRENPARWKGHLDNLLAPRKKLTRGHHAAMAFADVPAFIGDLRKREGIAPQALEFLVLTAARTGEVTGARWSEIDLAGKVWTVPKERMKAGKEHRVPLSDRAIVILQTLLAERPKDDRNAFVFPSAKTRRDLSNMAFAVLLNRMGCDVTAHGFRSAFRDWCGEATAFPREVAEAALAHRVGDEVELAYRRGDALEKRRKLMAAWAAFVEPKIAGSNVLPLTAKGRQ